MLNRLRACFLITALAPSLALGVPIFSGDSLAGWTDILVDGVSYDVSFVANTAFDPATEDFNSIYGDAAGLTFTTFAEATAALAVLGSLAADLSGDWKTWTNGCAGFACVFLAPYAVVNDDLFNGASVDVFSGSYTVAGPLLPLNREGYAGGNNTPRLFTVWEPISAEPTPVPEPSTTLLLAAALLSFAVADRLHRRRAQPARR